jgi:hypothetical protein
MYIMPNGGWASEALEGGRRLGPHTADPRPRPYTVDGSEVRIHHNSQAMDHSSHAMDLN